MRKLITSIIAASVCFLTACSIQGIEGDYKHNNNSALLLRLSKDGEFAEISGLAGTYKVDGKRITLTDTMFGSAQGLIEGDTITIDESPDSDVARTMAGTWIKARRY